MQYDYPLKPLLLCWGFGNSILFVIFLSCRLLFRFGSLLLVKELIAGIVVPDVPKVLSHGDDETSDNENRNESRVLAFLGLGFLGRLESRTSIINRLDEIHLVIFIHSLTDHLFCHHVAGREKGGGGIGSRRCRHDTARNGKGRKGSRSSLLEIQNRGFLDGRFCDALIRIELNTYRIG
jgi:hypothetical protein